MDSGFTELFRQLPPGIPVTFCVSAILLVIVVAYMVRSRSQKSRQALATAGAPGAGIDMASADLPDLDSLSTGEMRAAPSRSGAYRLTLVGGETVEAIEVLSVLRDVAEGGLIVRIGDKAYRNPPKSADAEFMRRFQGALRDLAEPPAPNLTPERETNSMFQPPRPPTPAPAPKPEPAPAPAPVSAVDEPAPPVAAELDDDDLPSEEALAAAPLPPLKPPMPKMATGEVRTVSPGALPGDLPKFKIPDTPVKPKRGQRPVAEPIPEINIAASIEAYLQHKLMQTPEFISRNIHVRPASHGGVHIEVDGIFYDSVGEVVDAEVRQFLADTIAEWQARQ